MKLSFIVPAYNEEHYLSDCLQSIIDQTHGMDVEIVVVSNASTDRTAEIAKQFPVVLVKEPRKGLPFARQSGLANSSGDLVANIDADSRLTSGWVQKTLKAFEESSNLVCLSGPYVYYDLPRLSQMGVQFFYWLGKVLCTISQVCRLGSMVQGGNFVVRRKALEAVGGYDTQISFYGEDTDIARRLFKQGEVRFSLGFKMLSSARRLKQEGVLLMAGRYTLNYVWIMLFKRPFTLTYKELH